MRPTNTIYLACALAIGAQALVARPRAEADEAWKISKRGEADEAGEIRHSRLN
ncbi:uncharacterized protein BO97DRAFT_422681 [Aspergillus homomorphus CBS 101889]|uniref:Uncharacterized protein n=1 Tax=Aspergillus homomorphus (strain CBS 101889) TaxID=1450537 RepID=A0A395I237_ASPHC|nr:hypothetical protein BO97DRAFT_422681 [Aspergillus homomorphus CBS 101889]RAL14252.1 hypothetical protein BO97DRAFT_422681 [Aspergillus homomorphus CBS 101889]